MQPRNQVACGRARGVDAGDVSDLVTCAAGCRAGKRAESPGSLDFSRPHGGSERLRRPVWFRGRSAGPPADFYPRRLLFVTMATKWTERPPTNLALLQDPNGRTIERSIPSGPTGLQPGQEFTMVGRRWRVGHHVVGRSRRSSRGSGALCCLPVDAVSPLINVRAGLE